MTTILIPLALALLYALAVMRFSVWAMQKRLDRLARPLRDARLAALCRQMSTALGIPRIEVQILDIEPVNGLATPDGRIFLTRGFLARHESGAVTDEELAAVIAHELGHVALGHLRRRMIDVTGQNAVFIVLASVLNRFLPIIGIWIANVISAALVARLSRRDEFEADAWASALLVKAGIGTGPQKSLFAKLDALTRTSTEGIPAWLLSHPSTAERIAAIEANEARWGLV